MSNEHVGLWNQAAAVNRVGDQVVGRKDETCSWARPLTRSRTPSYQYEPAVI